MIEGQGISDNTRAILLLTAPLVSGGAGARSAKPLSGREYNGFARWLKEEGHWPKNLLTPLAGEIMGSCRPIVDPERLGALLGRVDVLERALKRWSERSIWVLSRADVAYPRRIKERFGHKAPPVLYGSGDVKLLSEPGFAVVGSRKVGNDLLQFAERTGAVAAGFGRMLVSGGAKGVDESAMFGSLKAEGRALGVLSDGLEKALGKPWRTEIEERRLVLVSMVDPHVGFHPGNAMARNKVIYAFADAALVVETGFERGGTWSGAVEKLKEQDGYPVYVRTDGADSRGLEGLREKGARPWKEPSNAAEFEALMKPDISSAGQSERQMSLI